MTAEINAKLRSSPLCSGGLFVILPAALGIALGAALFSECAPLASALARAAGGYGKLFLHKYGAAEAFATAVSLSRADIALCFLAMLYPYMACTGFLTALTSFLRAALSTLAVASCVGSPFGIVSLIAGTLSSAIVLFRVSGLRLSGGSKPRDCARLIVTSSSAAGLAIAIRIAALLLCGLFVPA